MLLTFEMSCGLGSMWRGGGVSKCLCKSVAWRLLGVGVINLKVDGPTDYLLCALSSCGMLQCRDRFGCSGYVILIGVFDGLVCCRCVGRSHVVEDVGCNGARLLPLALMASEVSWC